MEQNEIAVPETALAKNVEANEQNPTIALREIPLKLFGEISGMLGIGEEVTMMVRGDQWHIRALNPTHQFTGFPGAIGYRKTFDIHRFGLWRFVPRPDHRDFEDESPIVSIAGGLRDGGMWSAGKGVRLEEKLTADFGVNHLKLDDISTRFIGLLLIRVNQMARGMNVTRESCWEVDKNPGGNFAESD